MSVRHLYLAALAAILACAPPAGTPNTARNSSILTSEEITKYYADVPSAYDAVERLRPSWLRPRGMQSRSDPDSSAFARVFVDGQPRGRLSALRDIQAYTVSDIEFYNVDRSLAKFGPMGGTGGVIEVRLKNNR